MRKTLITLAAILLLCVSLAAAKERMLLKSGEPFYEHRSNEVLVKFSDGVAAAEAASAVAHIGGRIAARSELLDFCTVELSTAGDLIPAIKALRADPRVEWANFNYIARACWTPNDPHYSYQWHYPRINMPQAWDITRGSSNVIVAVADVGWQFNHEDYAGVQTVSPYDAIDGDNNPSSTVDESHGMHVAGTILAATNNGIGVAGIAPLCRLMPVRCLNDSGSGTIAQISNGISWAATHGAHVLNLSLGFTVSGPPQDPGPPLSTAITQAANANVIICAASGNDGQPYVGYPAAYAACIAVGATAYNDAIAPYSNTGTALDVVAPGGNTGEDLNNDGYVDGVLSTVRSQGAWAYVFWQGTSMATPHVAGVAALLLSNGTSAANVRQALQTTAVDLGPAGRDNVFGYGRINALAALQWQGGGGTDVVLFEQGFETFPLQGWGMLENGTNGIGWQTLAGSGTANCGTTPHGGSNAVWHDDEDVGGVQDDRLRTPPIAIPAGATNVTFSFWQRNCYVDGYYDYHGLWYSTNGSTFTEVGEMDVDEADWVQVTVDATPLAGGSVWFEWRYRGDYATEWFLDDVRMTARLASGVDDRFAPVAADVRLADPYPNPFNSMAVIPLELSAPARVELSVYNTLGQRVATLLTPQTLNAGQHSVTWNAHEVAAGLYFIRLQSADNIQTRKLLLLK